MTIEEIKAKKLQLELQIGKLLEDFQKETTCSISTLDIQTANVKCGVAIVGVKLEIIL